MHKKRKSAKSDSPLGKDIESFTQEKDGYEAEEVSYVKSKKEVQKKKKLEGDEILDGLTHKVHVEYGDGMEEQKSDKKFVKKNKVNRIVLYNLLPIMKLLEDRIEKNDESKKLLVRYSKQQKKLKKYESMMICRGMIREHVKIDLMEKEYPFTTTLPYINPALQILQNMKFVNTFREKPKLRAKFDLDDARETIEKFRKRAGLNPIEKLRLERAKKILSKKNEDAHPLYVFLTKAGEKEIANIEKDGVGLISYTLRLIMGSIHYPIFSTADSEDNGVEDDTEE